MSHKMQIEGFEVMKKLGEGTYGCVFEAKRMADGNGKSVAIKVFRGRRSSWKREVQMLEAAERCEGVVRMLEYFEDIDNFFIVLELGGTTLWQLYEKKPAQPEEVRSILFYSIKALKELHEAGVLHGDLKSNNVCLQKKPSKEFPLILIDMGLSRSIDGDFCAFTPQAWQVQTLPSHNFKGGFYGERSEVYSLVLMCVDLLDIDLYDGLALEEKNRKELINKQEHFEKYPAEVLKKDGLKYLADVLKALNHMEEFVVQYDQLLEILKDNGKLNKFWKTGKSGCCVM